MESPVLVGGGGGGGGGNNSDSDLEQLVKIRAELMAKLEGDFKLSPEEEDSSSSDSDSDPEGTLGTGIKSVHRQHSAEFFVLNAVFISGCN